MNLFGCKGTKKFVFMQEGVEYFYKIRSEFFLLSPICTSCHKKSAPFDALVFRLSLLIMLSMKPSLVDRFGQVTVFIIVIAGFVLSNTYLHTSLTYLVNTTDNSVALSRFRATRATSVLRKHGFADTG